VTVEEGFEEARMKMQQVLAAIAIAVLLGGCGKPQGPASAAQPSAAANTASAAATAATPVAARSLGEDVFQKACRACHGPGIAGAPKVGDAAAWAPRIAQGIEVLHEHSLTGFTGRTGVMPPKGGFANLSDDEVKAAVDYMVAHAQ